MKKIDLNKMNNPTSVPAAARRLDVSQGAVWILIRQNIIPVALRGGKTVIDYDTLCTWMNTRPEILAKLKEVRTTACPHPLIEMFAPKPPTPNSKP